MATRRAALLLALVMAMADERAGLVLSGLVSDRTLRYVAAFARTRAARFIRLQAAAPTNHTGVLPFAGTLTATAAVADAQPLIASPGST